MPDHLERRGVLQDADHREACAGCRSAGRRTSSGIGSNAPSSTVEAGELEVRRQHAEVPVVAARRRPAVDDREPGRARARRVPDLALPSRSPSRSRRARTSCARGTRRRARGRGTSRAGRPARPACASTASTDWLADDREVAGVDAARRRAAPRACRRSALRRSSPRARRIRRRTSSSRSTRCTNDAVDVGARRRA